ncbi:DNA-directed RNA polymerase 30 kDa polypeptide [BeAn 58058 virus]|uniref:DNA-directed RNA polymerase 30 kDa polypeptide n=1 Tax=BeAn 58058 virus TaxID=67082 RepID=UPI00090A7135|nr:DNA-directed RNA polymerase 30 kDa polypeptide [BeAn 58058 virus]APG58245.1 DNA-directed RNA polymerase 30 kDa polypeptide [BeAn 58058 virus]
MLSNGLEKDILRYILFGIKCIQKGVEYNIDNIQDIDYSNNYFNVLDTKHNAQCPQCKGRNTMPIMIQTRAADEPPLVRQSCKDCNIHFKPPKFRNNNYIDINKKMKKEDTKDDDPSPSDSDNYIVLLIKR